MERYDYLEAVKEDVKQWIEDCREEIEEEMERIGAESIRDIAGTIYDKCFESDSVTGSPSGSYYCSKWKAEEALCHNWDLLNEAANDFGDEIDLSKGPEHYDVIIRCYVLPQAVHEVLEEIE